MTICWTTSSASAAFLQRLAKLGFRRGLARLAAGIGCEIPVQCGPVPFKLDLAKPYERHLLLGLDEAEVIRVLTTFLRDGDSAIDVGANIGFHTAIMAALVGAGGRVYSFEPNSSLRGRLDYIVAGNPLRNISVFQSAVSDEDGDGVLQVSSVAGLSSLGKDWSPATTVRREAVSTIRLDRFIEEHGMKSLKLVKIDVEGHEAAVFRGLARTVDRRLVKAFVFELTPPNHGAYSRRVTDEILLALESSGYSFWAPNQKRAVCRRAILDEPSLLAPGYNLAAIREPVGWMDQSELLT